MRLLEAWFTALATLDVHNRTMVTFSYEASVAVGKYGGVK